MDAAICAAIRDRAILEFSYNGGTRTVEPYCHGISRAGNELLRAYQISGYSSSGKSAGWKLFDVSKINGLRQTGATFSSNRPEYTQHDSAMTSIYCRI